MIVTKEKTKEGTTTPEIEVTIDNGDLELINSLTEAYSLKDKNSLFKFALAALLQGNNNEGIFTIKTLADNKKTLSKIAPSEDMLKKKTE